MSIRRATGDAGRGFTLVELLIALSLLLTFTLTVSYTLFVYVAEGTQANQRRLVATKLASSVIEQIRAMNYDDIGNCSVTQDANGNITNKSYPYTLSGQVPRQIFKIVENVKYTITTNILWTNDVNRHEDYKQIEVAVTALDPFDKYQERIVRYADLHTTIARKGEEKALAGGAVTITVYKYDKEHNGYVLAEGIDVILRSDDNKELRMTTDSQGVTVFQDVPVLKDKNGNYTTRRYNVTVDSAYTIVKGDMTVNVDFKEPQELTLYIKENE